ncbi:MAG: DNA primase [Spirochaetales bacterium]|nr:DNA primase [Spirochaetales bacterium]
MFIPEEIINEIADKTDIGDIIGSYITLKRTGRNLTGLCPFHTEKTPSFSVTPEKGMFYCFGCQKSGNVFSFIMEMEKLTFPEAVQYLAQKAGISLDIEDRESASAENTFRRQLYDLYEKVSLSFHYILTKKDSSEKARKYLEDRGINPDTIEKFRLGYAPGDRRWLFNFLKKKSYSEDFLSRCGLFSSNYRGVSIFSGRIIFPIISKSGRVIAFGGRSPDGSPPKYINSPETPIFRKSDELYGFNLAQKEIRKNDSVFIVEGYMDTMAMVQAGIENTVAPLGTAFTENHANIILKNCSAVVLVFDGDEAGLKATVKSSYICEKAGLECSVVELPAGSDPADILKNSGAEALKNILKYPINCFDFLLNKYKDIYDLTREDGIKSFLNRLFMFVSIQESEVRRTGRLKALSEALNMDYRPVYDDFTSYIKKDFKNKTESGVVPGGRQGISSELYLMLAAVDNYDYFYMIRDEFSIDDIQDTAARNLYIILEECYRNNSFSLEIVLEKIDNQDLKKLVAKKLSSDEFTMNPKQFIEDSINMIKLKNLQIKRLQLEKKIGKDNGADPYSMEKLIAEKLFYDKEIEKLKGTNGNVRVTE